MDALADAQHAFTELASRRCSAREFRSLARKVSRHRADEPRAGEPLGAGPDRAAPGAASYTEA